MTIEKLTTRAIMPVQARRTLNLRSGLELDEDSTNGLIEILDGLTPDMYFDDYSDSMALNSLQKYSVNRDSHAFDEVDPIVERHLWASKEYVEGIILADIPHRVLRERAFYDPNENNPVVCVSGTGETGTWNPEGIFPDDSTDGAPTGPPTGNCRTCQYSQWPNDTLKAKGIKAPRCPDRLRLFVKTPDMMKPAVLDLPGAFNRSWDAYVKKLGRNMLRPWEVVTVISIGVNNKGQTYLDCNDVGLIDSTQEDVVNVVNQMRQLAYLLVEDAQNFHVRNTGVSGYTADGEWWEAPARQNNNVVDSNARVVEPEPEEDPVPQRPGDEPTPPPQATTPAPAPTPEPEPEPVPAAEPRLSPVEAAKERLRQRNQGK